MASASSAPSAVKRAFSGRSRIQVSVLGGRDAIVAHAWLLHRAVPPRRLRDGAEVERGWSVRPDLVAREISPELSDDDMRAEDVPDIPLPRQLRPCCAFGTGLKVTLMSVPVPGVELGNIVSVDDLGLHQFDNGAISIESSRPGGPAINDEHNGLDLHVPRRLHRHRAPA